MTETAAGEHEPRACRSCGAVGVPMIRDHAFDFTPLDTVVCADADACYDRWKVADR